MTLLSTWADFAHECDWRVYGPGRFREQRSDGSYYWRQLMGPNLPDGYSAMRKSSVWQALVQKTKRDKIAGLDFMLTKWTGATQLDQQQVWIRDAAHLWNDERDLIPLILLDAWGIDPFAYLKHNRLSMLQHLCNPHGMEPFLDQSRMPRR